MTGPGNCLWVRALHSLPNSRRDDVPLSVYKQHRGIYLRVLASAAVRGRAELLNRSSVGERWGSHTRPPIWLTLLRELMLGTLDKYVPLPPTTTTTTH